MNDLLCLKNQADTAMNKRVLAIMKHTLQWKNTDNKQMDINLFVSVKSYKETTVERGKQIDMGMLLGTGWLGMSRCIKLDLRYERRDQVGLQIFNLNNWKNEVTIFGFGEEQIWGWDN